MKLTTKLNRLINEQLEGSDPRPWKSVWQILEDHASHKDELMETARTNRRYSNLSEEQWRLVNFVDAPCGLDSPGVIADGVCRRLIKDEPVELALRLSIGARIQWIECQTNGNSNYDDLWRPMLMAAAAHDIFALVRIAALWCSNRNRKPNNLACAAICDALVAINAADADGIQLAIVEARKRKCPKYLDSINTIIASADTGDTDAFNAGVSRMLSSFKQYMFGDEIYGIIDPFATGIYELVREYSPATVEKFNTGRKLPWDTEYWTWIRDVRDIQERYEQIDLPPLIHQAVFEMAGLEWAEGVRQNW